MRHPDPLANAILRAGAELSKDHGYDFGGTNYGDPPELDSEFVQVLMKHLIPMFNHKSWKEYRIIIMKSKIAALKAELKTLEKL